LHLTSFAEKVTLLVRGDRLTASRIATEKVNEPDSRIDIKYNTVVEALERAGFKTEDGEDPQHGHE